MGIALLRLVLIFYFAAFVLALTRILPRAVFYSSAVWLSSLGAVLHIVYLVLQMFSIEEVENYRLMMAFSLSALLLVVINNILHFALNFRGLSLFVYPAAFILIFQSIVHPEWIIPVGKGAKPVWLAIHLPLIFLGVLAFLSHFFFGIMYLLKLTNLKSKNISSSGWRYLPSLETCDDYAYKSMTVGFPLITVGTITGVILVVGSRDTFLHWRTPELLTVLSWTIFAFMIESRLMTGWRGKKAALLSITGFIILLISSLWIIIG